MEVPLKITSRNLEISDLIKDEIRRKADKLSHIFDEIIKCRVTVEAIHRHQNNIIMHNVRIDITVPGKEIVISRQPQKDLAIAIREAFEAAYRQLEDYARKHRGEVKHHEEAPQAYISSIFLDKGYGFLKTPEGVEIYFHKNSILNHNFEDLKIGTKVRFVKEQGEKGPQASSVYVIK